MLTVSSALDPLAPAVVRYIKLGPGGRWAEACIREGRIALGHAAVPHELALSGDREAIRAHLIAQGRDLRKASDFAREILDFYHLPPETLWVTEWAGTLWWAFARAEVVFEGGDGIEQGVRSRAVIGSWCNTSLKGEPLAVSRMSTRLTKVTSYRQTLCAIEAEDYLLRKLNGEEELIVLRAEAARQEVVNAAGDLIAALHWADFETFVDLLFARSGWHRTSAIGGTMKDADLVLEQAVTGETAFVQVKSSASQATLDDYLERFDANGQWSRLFFVCHSPRGSLSAEGRSDVHLWTRESLAERAIAGGLYDWLVARAA